MDQIVIGVKRRGRPSEKIIRGSMIFFAVFFLLQGIMFSTGFMLPCFLMAAAYYWYMHSSKKEYEYTLEDGWMAIDRVSDSGRRRLHEFPLADVKYLTLPDDPLVAPYRRGGTEKIRKFDYTSYEEGVPYYTMIVEQTGARAKFLLDLTPEALRYIRHHSRGTVRY